MFTCYNRIAIRHNFIHNLLRKGYNHGSFIIIRFIQILSIFWIIQLHESFFYVRVPRQIKAWIEVPYLWMSNKGRWTASFVACFKGAHQWVEVIPFKNAFLRLCWLSSVLSLCSFGMYETYCTILSSVFPMSPQWFWWNNLESHITKDPFLQKDWFEREVYNNLHGWY